MRGTRSSFFSNASTIGVCKSLQLRGDEHLEQELKDNREQFNIVHLQSNKLFYTCRERERERERVTLPRKLNQWRH